MRYIARILVVISIIVCSWFFVWEGRESYVFYGDSMGYYMYLPTTFIYHSHKALDWLPADKKFDNTVRNYLKVMREEGVWSPKGYLINKYTYGVAAMELSHYLLPVHTVARYIK